MIAMWPTARRALLFLLGLVWLVAAVAKFNASSVFASQASALGLPTWLPLGALPYVEIVIFLLTAAASLFGWRVRAVGMLNGVFFGLLFLFLVWEKAHGLGALGCGCFGVLQKGITASDFVRDGVLTLLAFAVVPEPRPVRGERQSA